MVPGDAKQEAAMNQERVHPLVREGRIAVVPGVYDVLSAKIAEHVGFPAVVLTGYGVAASHLGEPDFGLLTQTEILDVARRVTAAVRLAVIVDGDTGYGGPLNVQRMVRELVRMGARGVILEDQRWPKRCGHMRDKQVIDAEEHAAKIRAARDARGSQPFLITARTDALETHGLDEAIRRALLYKEAGADVLFVEGPRAHEELRRIGRELPRPLAVNLIEGGRTPLCSLEELHEMGFFSVGFVLSGLYAAAHALEQTYREIREKGTTLALGDRLMPFDEFNALVGLEARYAEDERYRA
jgi:methylisocitrate lyase